MTRRPPPVQDPLADDYAPPDAGHGCDDGWKTVTESYILQQTGRDDLSPEELTRRARAVVYPCRLCRPDLFYRWVEGHLSPDHDQATCPGCREAAAHPKGRRRPGVRPVPNEPPPRDPDPPRERADLA